MNRNKLICLVFGLLLAACDHKPPSIPDCLIVASGFAPDDCPGGGKCTFEYFPDSKLEITDDSSYLSFEVKTGENLVFHFAYKKHDNAMIMDDEYEEAIYFEVRPDGDTFLVTEDQLEKAGAIFARMCFCPDGGYHRITQGCIYGYKINGRTWNISLNLTATSESGVYNRMKQRDFSEVRDQGPE